MLFTSPLQVIVGHPDVLLKNTNLQPALDVLKAVPSVWDETRVLAPERGWGHRTSRSTRTVRQR